MNPIRLLTVRGHELAGGFYLMWFNPSLEITTDPVANLAKTANYQPDIIKPPPEISRISEISSKVVSENETPELSKLAELAELATPPDNQIFVSCGQCLHFKCHNAHGKGAGYCLIGGDYGLWGETQHQCIKFDAMVERVELPDPKPNAIMVKCFTPNGNLIEVEARDPQHAEWLRQSNPPQGILK